MARVSRWIQDLLTESPTQIPVKERKARKGFEGRRTKLPANRWFAGIFELNELRSCQYAEMPTKKPLSNAAIRLNYLQEFHRTRTTENRKVIKPGNAISKNKHTIGMFRNQFNSGKLYKDQSRSFIMSFRYTPEGHPCGSRAESRFLTFDDCRSLCIQAKVADPRFFTLKQIKYLEEQSKKNQELNMWAIPTQDEIDDLESIIAKNPYKSVVTYEIWKEQRFDSPVYEVPTPIQDEIDADTEFFKERYRKKDTDDDIEVEEESEDFNWEEAYKSTISKLPKDSRD